MGLRQSFATQRRGLKTALTLEPLMASGDWPLADWHPDPAGDRLQAEAMFVHRPELDFGVWVLVPLVGDRRLKLFLSAARPSSPAAAGWRGRGCWSE